MASPKSTIRALRQQIQDNLVRSESGRYFLPSLSITTIFTSQAIDRATKELECGPDERIGLAETIQAEGIKTFAILIWMKEEDSIVDFRTHQTLDSRLPFGQDQAKRVAPEFGARLAQEEQWKFIPFCFPERMHLSHVDVGPDWIIPFVGRSETFAEGAFSHVLNVNIASSQQSFTSNRTDAGIISLVVKRLKSTASNAAYQQERKFLRLLNQLDHPNIIPFLGSYSFDGYHNLLFPRLSMDLKSFFQMDTRFGSFQHDFTFYSAMRGLCSALLNTHTLHLNQSAHGVDFEGIGYHHDIRPANILVTEHTFVLADFGLGDLKPTDAHSQAYWKQTTGDYLAPECMDKDLRPQNVGRAIDIWAIGCLLADVSTYMQRGRDGIKEFSNQRLCDRLPGFEDSLFHDTQGTLKSSVTDWLGSLTSNDSDGTSISRLVELSLRALTSDPIERPKIRECLAELTWLSLHAHFSIIHKKFSAYVHIKSSSDLQLLQTRFLAWGYVLGVGNDRYDATNICSESLGSLHNPAIKILLSLNQLFGIEDTYSSDHMADDMVDQEVGALWEILPEKLRRRASDYWQHVLLEKSDSERLTEIEQVLASSRFSAYYATRALATMAKTRLAIVYPDTMDSNMKVQNWRISGDEVIIDDETQLDGWTITELKDKTPVLVEWMWYTHGWQKVDPEQRSLTMSFRAQSFGLDEKPSSLRTMECMGFFEKTGPNFGYGFVYRIPPGVHPTPRPLFQLLDDNDKQPKKQPLLGDKFKLASAIADFLKQFHTVGWVHESFNSRNILFFQDTITSSHPLPSSDEMQRPYFVGLHKSRPDGSAWQTAGPESGTASDYHHPKYASSGRYEMEFDYYSLGIILLEIGFWRSLSSMLSSSKSKLMTAAELREKHIKRCKARLGEKMGGVYRDVVLRCLDGSFDRDKLPTTAATGHEHGSIKTGVYVDFIERVAEPLADLAATGI